MTGLHSHISDRCTWLQVTNLHVRYEDAVTQPGHPFTVGMTMHRISACTVDENGNDVFVYKSAMDLLRKSAELARLAVYFDTGVLALTVFRRDAAHVP